MAIDTLPVAFVAKTRDRIKADYLRSYKIRNPNARTEEGTQPDIDASIAADVVLPLWAVARHVADATSLESMTGSALDQRAAEAGIPPRLEAGGASGFVEIEASAGGGTIYEGDELTNVATRMVYECAVTALYVDGDLVPVRGVSTGEQTNLDPDVVLTWSSPRPGIGPSATVAADTQGNGLTGGRVVEGDDEIRERIRDARGNPKASGNEAEIRDALAEIPGLRIQYAFVWPGIVATGTCGFSFTLNPARPGGSRAPNATQLAEALAYLQGRFPADDGLFAIALVEQNVDLTLDVEWADGAVGWSDATPWPPYYAPSAGPGAVVVSAVTSATGFTLATDDADYTGVVQPVVGQTIAVYDQSAAAFRRKRIASFTGTGPWVIVVDESNAVSDTTYTPIVGQRVCPWSDSLDDLAAPLAAYFDATGPGEMVANPFDAGLRQKRVPRPPKQWPINVSNRAVRDVLDLASVQDAEIVDGLGTACATGSPGVSARLLRLRYLAAFPLL